LLSLSGNATMVNQFLVRTIKLFGIDLRFQIWEYFFEMLEKSFINGPFTRVIARRKHLKPAPTMPQLRKKKITSLRVYYNK